MKIAMALENHTYPQDVRVRGEAQELVVAGCDVIVLAPRTKGQRRSEVVDGVRVRRYRLPILPGAVGILLEYAVAGMQLTLGLLLEMLRGVDVIHLHNPPDLLFPVAGVARALGRTVIFDHHDLAPELYVEKFGDGWPASVLRWCERMTMRTAHLVISANESHRSIAVNRGGVSPERVVVVRNGPRRETIVAQPHVREGALLDPRLCYVGALGAQDGVAVLPELLLRLRSRGLDPTLTVVGDGPELRVIERLARDRGMLDRIEFTGRVAHRDVPRLILEADICVDVAPCGPLNHQSTMIKIGEYLAAGRPVVSFALEETRRTAGNTSLYAPCADLGAFCDLIVRLCRDEVMRSALSRDAVARAHELTWERSAERLRYGYGLVTTGLAAREESAREPDERARSASCCDLR